MTHHNFQIGQVYALRDNGQMTKFMFLSIDRHAPKASSYAICLYLYSFELFHYDLADVNLLWQFICQPRSLVNPKYVECSDE